MKALLHRSRRTRGYSFAELALYAALASALGLVSYSFLLTGIRLSTKNRVTNNSHDSVRRSFDRLAHQMQALDTVPLLINSAGATTAAPAAGLMYDRLVGTPFVFPMAGQTLPATTTVVRVTRSRRLDMGVGAPSIGDAILIDNTTIRRRITGVSSLAAAGATQTYDLTLSSSLGAPLTWLTNQAPTARIVRREAFIVMPNGARNELRFYPSFEPVPALNAAANYRVITNEVGTLAGEATPFTLTTVGADTLVNGFLRIRAREAQSWLASKQKNDYATFFRLSAAINSHNRQRPTLAP